MTVTCNSQLQVTPATYGEYARAAALLWGEAGEFAAAEFGRRREARPQARRYAHDQERRQPSHDQ